MIEQSLDQGLMPEQEVATPKSTVPAGPNYAIGSSDFMQVIKNGLGGSENAGKYETNLNASSYQIEGAIGKYQFIPARLQELGYTGMTPQAFTPSVQEEVMNAHLNDLLTYAQSKGMINTDTSPEQAAGLLWAGHLGGKGGMNAVAEGRQGASDRLGTSVNHYYAKGSRKFKAAQLANQLSDRMLPQSNSGTEQMLQSAGDLKAKTSISEMFHQGMESAFSSQNYKVREIQKDLQQEVIEQASKDKGIDLQALIDKQLAESTKGNPQTIKYGYTNEDKSQAFDAVIARLKAEDPSFKPKYSSTLDISKATGEKVTGLQQEYSNSAEAATFTQRLAGGVGSMIGFLKDPINLAAMLATAPLFPGMGIAPALGRSGAAMAAEVPVQAALQPELEKVGLPSGLKEGALNVGLVGLGSLALDGLVQGVIKGASKLFDSGPKGLQRVSEAFKSPDLGDSTKPIQGRVAASMGEDLGHTATILEKAPAADTAIGRQHLVESLDSIDTLMTNGKVADVYPTNAPIYEKVVAQESKQLMSKAIEDLDPEMQAALKAEVDEWDQMSKDAVTGTEQDAARTPIQAQEMKPLKAQTQDAIREQVDQLHATLETPDYRQKLDTQFDDTIIPMTENLDATINVARYEAEKLASRITRDKSTIDNWDEVAANPDAKPHQVSETAKQHIQDRILKNETDLKTKQDEMAKLEAMKEQQLALPESEVPTKTIRFEDAEGNVISRKADDVMKEIHEERTAWQEFSDCIKRGGVE